jgi:hypothetical protein
MLEPFEVDYQKLGSRVHLDTFGGDLMLFALTAVPLLVLFEDLLLLELV